MKMLYLRYHQIAICVNAICPVPTELSRSIHPITPRLALTIVCLVTPRRLSWQTLDYLSAHHAQSGSFIRLHRQAVCSMMAARYGMRNILATMDNFLIVCQSRDQALETLNTLISLIRKLGFWINYSKVEGPSTRLTFFGVILGSVQNDNGITTG